MQVLESTIERKVCRDAKRKYGIENVKLNGPGQTGWPDRMFLVGEGRTVFVEFKRPGGKLRPRQKVVIGRMAELGIEVRVTDNYDDAIRFLLWAQNDSGL